MQTQDPTEERLEEETPEGGTHAIAYYQDDLGLTAPKSRATRVMIIEFDPKGEEINRTYGMINS